MRKFIEIFGKNIFIQFFGTFRFAVFRNYSSLLNFSIRGETAAIFVRRAFYFVVCLKLRSFRKMAMRIQFYKQKHYFLYKQTIIFALFSIFLFFGFFFSIFFSTTLIQIWRLSQANGIVLNICEKKSTFFRYLPLFYALLFIRLQSKSIIHALHLKNSP